MPSLTRLPYVPFAGTTAYHVLETNCYELELGNFCRISRARYWASIYWHYTGPCGTSLLVEGGAKIPRC